MFQKLPLIGFCLPVMIPGSGSAFPSSHATHLPLTVSRSLPTLSRACHNTAMRTCCCITFWGKALMPGSGRGEGLRDPVRQESGHTLHIFSRFELLVVGLLACLCFFVTVSQGDPLCWISCNVDRGKRKQNRKRALLYRLHQ